MADSDSAIQQALLSQYLRFNEKMGLVCIGIFCSHSVSEVSNGPVKPVKNTRRTTRAQFCSGSVTEENGRIFQEKSIPVTRHMPLPRRHIPSHSSTSVVANTPEALAAGDDFGSMVDAGAVGMVARESVDPTSEKGMVSADSARSEQAVEIFPMVRSPIPLSIPSSSEY